MFERLNALRERFMRGTLGVDRDFRSASEQLRGMLGVAVVHHAPPEPRESASQTIVLPVVRVIRPSWITCLLRRIRARR